MSCIRFNTPAQERQLDALRESPELASQAVAAFLSPPVTDTKIARLRAMAADRRPKIRESAALNVNTPADVFEQLSRDPETSVRVCVARNEATPCDVLRTLATDASEEVRSWVAINYFVPADAMEFLADDPSAKVRKLVAWKASLTPEAQLVSSAVSDH
jgi:hypothetical protein